MTYQRGSESACLNVGFSFCCFKCGVNMNSPIKSSSASYCRRRAIHAELLSAAHKAKLPFLHHSRHLSALTRTWLTPLPRPQSPSTGLSRAQRIVNFSSVHSKSAWLAIHMILEYSFCHASRLIAFSLLTHASHVRMTLFISKFAAPARSNNLLFPFYPYKTSSKKFYIL